MRTKKQLMACLMSFALLLGMLPANEVSAAKKVSLSTKQMTITKGKSKTLKVKNTKKNVKWEILSGKKCITLKKKGKLAVTIKGKQKGTAKVQATAGKKKITCKVIVKDAADNSTGKNKQDVAALKALIAEQRKNGATVSENINNNNEYIWKDGKLTEIHWSNVDLSYYLDASNFTDLTFLDVSQNVNLTGLNCSGTKLSSLDVTKNVNLIGIDCSYTKLSSLDVSENVNLTDLVCNNTELSSLDVTKNVNLTSLNFVSCELSSIDVSQNVNLTEILCTDNKLSSLDVTNNTKLEFLDCDKTVTVIGYNK